MDTSDYEVMFSPPEESPQRPGYESLPPTSILDLARSVDPIASTNGRASNTNRRVKISARVCMAPSPTSPSRRGV
jgi:hypothetical protein